MKVSCRSRWTISDQQNRMPTVFDETLHLLIIKWHELCWTSSDGTPLLTRACMPDGCSTSQSIRGFRRSPLGFPLRCAFLSWSLRKRRKTLQNWRFRGSHWPSEFNLHQRRPVCAYVYSIYIYMTYMRFGNTMGWAVLGCKWHQMTMLNLLPCKCSLSLSHWKGELGLDALAS